VVAELALAMVLAAAPPDPALVASLRSAPAGGPRAVASTRALVAAPYLPSPLGEGTGVDPDPRFRLDAFDCITFVETAIALSSASSVDEAALAMDDIRYAGPPALAARNHEVLSQWIPANVAKGWIAESTREVAGPLARPAEKVYTPASWALVRDAGRAIRGLPRSRLPLGHFSVDLVPTADVPAVERRIPEGALAFVVRADAPDRATRITHVGLVVRGPGGAVHVRHATSSKGVGRVIEEPLGRFVQRQARAFPRWPIEGLAFFTIRDNTPRVHALRSAPPDSARAPGAKGPSPPPPARL